MKKSDKINLRKKTPAELSKELLASQKELFELRVKHNLEPIKNTSLLKKLKTKISFIKLLQHSHE